MLCPHIVNNMKEIFMSSVKKNLPWVIFSLHNQRFAFSVNDVREMVAMQKIVSVPDNPSYFRGVTNLRGQVLPVVDLRKKMGMPGLSDEMEDMIEMLTQREEDHRKWIDELEASVREKRAFKLTTDPHECAFGKWYDSFSTDNLVLDFCLKKFDEPHKKIHEVGNTVRNLVNKGSFDSAIKIIEQTKNLALSEMIGLFAETRNILKDTSREILMVIDKKGIKVCVSVDAIVSVERIPSSNIDEKPSTVSFNDNNCIVGIGKRRGNSELVHLLDVEKLLSNSVIGVQG